MPLGPGSIAFVGFNSDGNDNLAFVALDVLPAGTTIYFSDNEWTGAAFNGGESAFHWTAVADIAAGTIITIDNVGSGTIAANLGMVAFDDSSNRGIANSDEIVYAYIGASHTTPTAFLAAIANDTFANGGGTLAGTGLTAGVNALELAAIDTDADVAAFAGNRGDQANFADYLPIIHNAANWVTQDASGNQSADGTAPDVPFSTAGFWISGPGPQTIGFALGSLTVTQAEGNAGTTTFTFVVERSGGTTGQVDFSGAVAAGDTEGDDFAGGFAPTSFSGTIADGAASGTVTIDIAGDTIDDPTESFVLTLTTAANDAGVVMTIDAAADEATGMIVNDDTGTEVGDITILPAADSTLHGSLATPVASNSLDLTRIGGWVSGNGEGGAESLAFDPETDRLFVTSAAMDKIEILDLSNPFNPVKIDNIDLSGFAGYGEINSVAVKNGIVAVAFQKADGAANGFVHLYDADGNLLKQLTVGIQPDQLTFSPDGGLLLVANEGERIVDRSGVDPVVVENPGTVTIIDLSAGAASAIIRNTIGFGTLDGHEAELAALGIRIFGGQAAPIGNNEVAAPASTASGDIEPEYISVSPDGTKAYVTLQEVDAVGVIDLTDAAADKPVSILPLGFVDHGLAGNEGDFSDRDGPNNSTSISINTSPVKGLLQPDAIATFVIAGITHFITANEGDSRIMNDPLVDDPDGFNERRASAVQAGASADYARLNVDTVWSAPDDLYAFGGRGFSIFRQEADGSITKVEESGGEFQKIIAALPNANTVFNGQNGGAFDTRSDNKGPEPEGVEIATIHGHTYAFITLERAGGVMVYDVSVPEKAQFVRYVEATGDDFGPEVIRVIPPEDSPTGNTLVLTANEISGSVTVYQAEAVQPDQLRAATFNASLNRSAEGELASDLSTPDNAQAKTVAEIIQRAAPDVLLINEFDYDDEGPGGSSLAALLYRQNYLEIGQNGAAPIEYPYVFVGPSNTGIASGFDLNNNGEVDTAPGAPGYGDDALGFGQFPGQFGMAFFSKYPILTDQVRTFQEFLWKDMPGALLPDDPNTPEPNDWYSPEELAILRLSSKSHWDIPVLVGDEVVHILAAHPTPPVFDGPEDRNGLRNHDEIRFWSDYVTPGAGDYIYDDEGAFGGLAAGARFVILGDYNADPFDGDSVDDAIDQLLGNARIDDDEATRPSSLGGPEQAALQGGANASHIDDPAYDTADFADGASGNLRVDYVLPSKSGLTHLGGEVFWPASSDPLFPLVGTFPFPSSDHRLVFADLQIDEVSLPNGISSGDVDQDSAVLWARSSIAGDLAFEVATDAGFTNVVHSSSLTVTDTTLPAKLVVGDLQSGTEYFYRVTAPDGADAVGRFETAHDLGTHEGFSFGVSGDWRGELSPYPAIANADERGLDLFVKLGDTIYADIPSPAVPDDQAETLGEFRAKHDEVYSERFGLGTWADLQAVTPILATIDDHEVTNDFAGGAHPSSDPRFLGQPGDFINETSLYQAGLQAFGEYNAIEDRTYSGTGNARIDGAPDLYRANTYGSDAAVFVLDARSFRDEELPAVADPTNPAQVATFLTQSFDPSRTMLGEVQIEQLEADLLAAQANGITWKFVMMPEPIQNIGVVAASDRYEGYAAERAELLEFIESNYISNVVFVSADIHGTLVNNLTYQTEAFGPQIATGAWEITTGSVAFDAPLGQTVAALVADLGLLTPAQKAFYDGLPIGPDADSNPLNDRDDFIENLVNQQMAPLGYDPLGLDNNLEIAQNRVDATLLAGDYTVAHTFGWTEFDIDSETQALTVTTWGILPYAAADLEVDPYAVAARTPTILNQFVVQAQDAITPIYAIQGSGHTSAFEGQVVTTRGVVTAVDTTGGRGFYIQDPNGDGDGATSDAIFVFMPSGTLPTVGRLVDVKGTVTEFTPGGASAAPGSFSITEITSPTVTDLGESAIDIAPTVIGGPSGILPPTEDLQAGGVFWEALEGMLVQVESPRSTGPSNRFGEIYTVVDDDDDPDNGYGGATGLTDRGNLLLTPGEEVFGRNDTEGGDYNPERVQIQRDAGVNNAPLPAVNTGAILNDVTGVVSYAFGNYEIVATEAVTVATPSTLVKETTTLARTADKLLIASYNAENLDPGDGAARFATLAQEIFTRLGAPDILALQEVQDNDGPTNSDTTSASQTLQMLVDALNLLAGPGVYAFKDNPFIGDDTNGGQPGGNIRNAFLYRTDRVEFVNNSLMSVSANGGAVTEPGAIDQQINPDNPFFGSRPPLVATFIYNGQEITVINNHLASKGGSGALLGSEQPSLNASEVQRAAQAQAINNFVDNLLAANEDAKVVVAGDLNDFGFEQPLSVLKGTAAISDYDVPGNDPFVATATYTPGGTEVLFDLQDTLPADEQFDYNFEGNSQTLDHIVVSSALTGTTEFDVIRINADFADQTSDHDPLAAALDIAVSQTISGNNGSNTLSGDTGNDKISGGNGNDTIIAGDGNDQVFGGNGNDILNGGRGGDLIEGGNGNDTIDAGSGNNRVFGGNGSDSIVAGNGRDLLDGENGHDAILAGGGKDTVYGGSGNDVLDGGPGDDAIVGGSGNDVITGGEGNDTLTGNSGNDRFVFDYGFGQDRITDFATVDVIAFQTTVFQNFGQVQAASQQVGSDVVVTIEANNVLILEDVQLSQLQLNDFNFF